MTAPDARHPDRLPAAFTRPGSSSFVDFLRSHAPELLPGAGPAPQSPVSVPHATTIVALTYAGGMVMAGDRRATAGSAIAHRQIEKVFAADSYSVIGIAGTAGIAVELVRLFQLELEHYEKIEGTLLSLQGKANRLGSMVRGNLPMALQGLVALPLFGGYDQREDTGRIFSYDVVGGRYDEHDFHAIGSGAVYAKGSLKKVWHPGLDPEGAVRVALHALMDAADDDSATGGPDARRGIYPIVVRVDATGHERIGDDRLAALTAEIDALPERSREA